jgi:UDP-N-acetylmuramoyl-tripeptide--D-alanyl-D-alanine ligase
MKLWNIESLNQALKEILIENTHQDHQTITEYDEVIIDSRKPSNNSVFIALKGENNDGHNFLNQAYQSGAKIAIVNYIPTDFNNDQLKLIVVSDTYQALYKLAQFSRSRTKAKIIAITGSVGKTGTKEMLKTVFQSQGKTFANHGNFNNHIGLPLSLANLPADCEYGIFEMGMNHLKEIEPLSNLAKPHLAIITNVGPVHIEFFKDEQEIALAKSEIFSGLVANGFVLINRDNPHFEFLANRAKINDVKDENILNFGTSHRAIYQIIKQEIQAINHTEVSLKLKNGDIIDYQVSYTNQAVVVNSAIAIVALDLFSKNFNLGIQEIKKFTSSAGRGAVSEILVNSKKITLIDDTYNASVLSMKSGIENANNLKRILNKKRIVCALGDMLELGDKSIELHDKVIGYLKEYNIDLAILVGQRMKNSTVNIEEISHHNFSNSIEASESIESLLENDDILYIKGSRGMKMEKIIEKLTNKSSAH